MHTRVLSLTQTASRRFGGLLYCAALLLISSPLNAGIVAHFRFDESAGLTATNSAGPNFGTLSPGGASFAYRSNSSAGA